MSSSLTRDASRVTRHAIMPYEILIAIRHLRSGGLQTILIIGGATIGVAMFIVISALLNGSKAEIIKKVTGTGAHIIIKEEDREPKTLEEINLNKIKSGTLLFTDQEKVSQRKAKISSWPLLKEQLFKIDKNIDFLSPKASGQCFISRGEKTMSILLDGVIPDMADKVVNISSKVKEGSFLSLGNDQIVIGKKLAKDLGVTLKDRVRILSPEGIGRTCQVSGIFSMGAGSMDEGYAITTLDSAQQIFKLDNDIISLEIHLKDIYSADEVAKKIKAQTEYKAESWMSTNSGLMQAIKAQDNTGYLIKYFSMVIVALAIASVLVVSVIEKSKDIGILKAMGATNRSIVRIFLIEGLIVGLIGAIVGTSIGLCMAYGLKQCSTEIEFEGSTYSSYPMEFSFYDIITAMVTSIMTGLLGAIFPARRASKMDVVVCLKLIG